MSQNLPLEGLLHQLQDILQSIPALENQGYKPPIIEGAGYSPHGEPITGLRIFKETVTREVEILQQFLARKNHGSELSTNAPYFIAVWNEILAAPPPILAIGKILDPLDGKTPKHKSGTTKAGGIKIDVVADEGRKWIRVNTMKNSRLLAEFREFDSYLTDSEDDGEDGEAFDAPTDKDSSLLRMGRTLVAAMEGTVERPHVTLRLTRLRPDMDTRIAQTIESLREMGLDVQLGERAFRKLEENSAEERATVFQPTRQINMDLSMLIALVSDLSHAELPKSEEEAWERFRTRSWKLGKDTNHEAVEEHSKHSRALSIQCMQEMEHGLIDEIAGRIGALGGPVEFWTTKEARERCFQIVAKIGGEDEKRRAAVMFSMSSENEFWHGSRYTSSHLPSLLPIRVHSVEPGRHAPTGSSLFWGHLVETCGHILAHDSAPHPRLYRKHGEMERAKVSTANTKLTVHTVESMLIGACEGMTTLTANKSSVKALLREMKNVKYADGDVKTCGSDSAAAAIWIVEPRSLAEGMRTV